MPRPAGARAFARVERLRRLSKAVRGRRDPAAIRAERKLVGALSVEAAGEVAHAFSLFFQLVNLCEERARVRHLLARPDPPQSIRRTLSDLRARGVTTATLQRCLDRLEVGPVLAFGFHLAPLDVRDHSAKLTGAPREMFEAMRALARIQRNYGEAAAHHVILSMTRSSEDHGLRKGAPHAGTTRRRRRPAFVKAMRAGLVEVGAGPDNLRAEELGGYR